MRKWICKGILPIITFLLLLYIFKTVYIVNGTIDWFRVWMIVGIPFGMGRMCVWILPRGYDLGATVGIMAFGIIISGIIGGFIAIYTVIEALLCLILMPLQIKKSMVHEI